MHIDPGHPQGHLHLDDELIARRGQSVRRCSKPVVELAAADCRDAEDILGTIALRIVGLHQSVALKSLQGRIDLPYVERPHFSGPGLELLPEPQAILRALAE
jgi:hypothetical protein